MTSTEFAAWFQDYCNVFPDCAAFFNSKGKGSDAYNDLLHHWHDAMMTVDFEYAMHATKEMVAGRMETVRDFHHHETPAHVRRLVEELADDRNADPVQTTYEPLMHVLDQQPTLWSALDSYRQLVILRKTGATRIEIEQTAQDLMELAKRRKLSPTKDVYLTAVVCQCDAGKRYECISRGGYDMKHRRFNRDTQIIYDRGRWIPAPHRPDQNDIDKLSEKMQSFVPMGEYDVVDFETGKPIQRHFHD